MESSSPTPPSIGEVSGLRGFLHAGLLYFEARARLFQIEAGEAGQSVGRLFVAAIAAIALIGGAWLLLMPVIVWGVARLAGCSWQLSAGVIGGLHFIVGVVLVLRVKAGAARLKLFEESINQCRRDRECLGRSQTEVN